MSRVETTYFFPVFLSRSLSSPLFRLPNRRSIGELAYEYGAVYITRMRSFAIVYSTCSVRWMLALSITKITLSYQPGSSRSSTVASCSRNRENVSLLPVL